MVTLADSLVSSTSRPLQLRMRPDLSARRHRYHGTTFWVVKEPVGLSYYRFHEEEYAILCMLDGHHSLDEIKEQFEQQYQPQKITFQDLLQFVGMLHRSGLVISESPGQGHQLRKRRDDKKWRELMGKFTNVFSMRFRGVDPERFFNWLYPFTGWFFTPAAIICVLMLATAALSLVLVNVDVFTQRLPAFHEFFGPRNWIWLGITMGLVKVLHEFGHGLSCKHYGGECHELGAMLLVFTPALYCNVSDSWMLPNKYHRAFIGAAGMYVELFLASVATFVWWFSEPGMINHIALSVMFICSVSTIVFNGNPLLRFDGYYILMDLLEIPNLRQKATEITRRFLLYWCLGIEQPENPFLPQGNRWAFALFTVAAVAYRWVVVFSILFFLNQVFEPIGLKVVGQLIAFTGLVGLVVQPIMELWKFFRAPGRMNKVKRTRVAITLASIAGVVALLFVIPMPFSVKAACEVQPRQAVQVFAATPGQLDEVLVKPGDRVEAGDVLAKLLNPDLELELLRMKSQCEEAKVALDNLYRLRFTDPTAVDQIEAADQVLQAAERQYQERLEEAKRLTITAPVAGVVIPAPRKPAKAEGGEGRLKTWTGAPLSDRNRGALFTPTDLLCVIGDVSDLEAILVIDQAYIDLVRKDQDVRVLLESHTGEAFDTKVEEIAATELKVASIGSSSKGGGRLDTYTDASGMQRPLNTSYQASAPLGNSLGNVQVGQQGQARIYTGWQPLGKRLYRYLAKTFHFDL